MRHDTSSPHSRPPSLWCEKLPLAFCQTIRPLRAKPAPRIIWILSAVVIGISIGALCGHRPNVYHLFRGVNIYHHEIRGCVTFSVMQCYGMETTFDIIKAAGGRDAVAKRLGATPETVSNRMSEQRLPAAWYGTLCLMTGHSLPWRFFSFKGLDE